jgi:hypothetical protein
MQLALRVALVLVTVAATAGTSRADWSYGGVPNPYATQLYYDAFGHGRRNASQASTDAPAIEHRPLKATDFKRTNGRPVLDEFMASTGLEGAQADELRAVMEAQLATLEAPVRKNNVAAAMGVLFVTSYRVVNGIQITDESRDSVIAFVNDALAVQQSFKKLKAKGRQEVADTALVQAALIELMSAEADPAMQEVAINGARKALLELTGSETGDTNPLTLDYGDVID